MKTLSFYDVKTKKKFNSSKYDMRSRLNRGRKTFFAVAKSKSGIEAWRIVSEDFYRENV